jgi:hypothetical protein
VFFISFSPSIRILHRKKKQGQKQINKERRINREKERGKEKMNEEMAVRNI